jgi:hypothetical protein
MKLKYYATHKVARIAANGAITEFLHSGGTQTHFTIISPSLVDKEVGS